MKKYARKALAIALCLVLVAVCVPFSVFAANSNNKIAIGSISDLHVYSQSLLGDDLTNFLADVRGDTKQFEYTEQLLETALYSLAQNAKKNGMKYVLIPGDLSKDGEIASHEKVAQMLKDFEASTGISVYVINGNHDINNSNAASYVTNSNVKDASLITSPEKFREIYADFGYNDAYHTYVPAEGKGQGQNSYSVKLDGNYRLIAIDTCCYTVDATEDANTEHETRGMLSDALLEWVLSEIDDAKKNGETVIGLCHHGIVAHHDIENNILKDFVVDGWEDVATSLANAGMHYVFTGHQHSNDIASYISADGETIFDCEVDSLASYPHYFKQVVFDNTIGKDKVAATYSTYPVDCGKKMTTLAGEEIPSFERFSFSKVFLNNGDGDVAPFFNAIMGDFVISFINGLNDKYSLGIKPEQVDAIAKDLVDRLKVLKVSEIPSTKFKNTLGFSDTTYGTLSSAICEAWHYLSAGDEYIADDEFMLDVIKQCKEGDTGLRVVNTLLECIYQGAGGNPEVINFVRGAYAAWGTLKGSLGEALGGIDLGSLKDKIGSAGESGIPIDTSALEGLTSSLPFDTSALSGLGDTLGGLNGGADASGLGDVLGGITGGDSGAPAIDTDTIVKFIQNPDLVGQLLAYAVECFCIDVNPGEKQDNFYTHSYLGKIEPSNGGGSNPNIPGGSNPGTGGIAEMVQQKELGAEELIFVLPVCALALIATAVVRKRKEEV